LRGEQRCINLSYENASYVQVCFCGFKSFKAAIAILKRGFCGEGETGFC
jgi:hypothetical protein